LAERYETAVAHQQVIEEQALVAEGAVPAAPAGGRAVPAAEGQRPVVAPFTGFDPNAVTHHLEAWMPETIATYKLRGFVHDVGGEVVESVPGKIRVRLGGRGSQYAVRTSLGWLGLGRKSGQIDMELQLKRPDPGRESLLLITVQLRPYNGTAAAADWRARATQIYCDLRAYLMGHTS
jgi:serine/threonine-protein kinase